MAGGFSVARAALNESARGINDSIAALKSLGLDETAEVGRGFSGVALSGLPAGDAGLGLTAGIYADTEQYLTGVAKNVTVALAGDPHLSDGQAARASWSRDAAGVSGAATPGSGTTWAQAGQQARQQWAEVRRDELKGPEALYHRLSDATGGTTGGAG